MAEHLTAAEAAARLGVKKETLYAYVSRGVIDRTMSLDGRSSLFDAAQVDRLRRSRRRKARGELETVLTTHLTEITESGHRHRGTPIGELVPLGFEATADHLWGTTGDWSPAAELVDAVAAVMTALPSSTPLIDRYRTAVAAASGLDPLRHNPSPEAVAAAGRAMVMAVVSTLAGGSARTRAKRSATVAERCHRGLVPQRRSSTAERAEVTRAIDAALALLADHGMAASTFAARLAASVRADPYSIVAAGMGPVGGQLHGAASGAVHRMLADAAEHGVDATLGELLASGDRLPGVGHAVYVECDPRDLILWQIVTEVWADDPRLEMATSLRTSISDMGHMANIDFALGSLTFLADMPVWGGEALFAAARIVGWLAHGIEEFDEPAGRFRPVARYVTAPDADTLATA